MNKKFKNINFTLNKLLDQYNLSHVYSMELIKKGWAKMDRTIASHSEPVEYNQKYKTLKIRIENLSWKKEFLENSELLLSKVKSHFTNIEINKIDFI